MDFQNNKDVPTYNFSHNHILCVPEVHGYVCQKQYCLRDWMQYKCMETNCYFHTKEKKKTKRSESRKYLCLCKLLWKGQTHTAGRCHYAADCRCEILIILLSANKCNVYSCLCVFADTSCLVCATVCGFDQIIFIARNAPNKHTVYEYNSLA